MRRALLNLSLFALVGYILSLLFLGTLGGFIAREREPGMVPYFVIFAVLCGALFLSPYISARRRKTPIRPKLVDTFMAIFASLSFVVSSAMPEEDVPWLWLPIQIVLLMWVPKWFLISFRFPPNFRR